MSLGATSAPVDGSTITPQNSSSFILVCAVSCAAGEAAAVPPPPSPPPITLYINLFLSSSLSGLFIPSRHRCAISADGLLVHSDYLSTLSFLLYDLELDVDYYPCDAYMATFLPS